MGVTAPVTIRAATVDDAPQLTVLALEYMRDVFGAEAEWPGSAEALVHDGFGRHFNVVVGARSDELVAFAVWRNTYDFHNCIPGAEIIDLYVQPSARGHAVALRIVAAIAAAAQVHGATFVKGQTTGKPEQRRLYERIAVAFEGADCIVGGRAFRTLAALDGKPVRAMIRGLPDKASNYEP